MRTVVQTSFVAQAMKSPSHCTHDGERSRVRGQLRLRSSRLCAGCFFLHGSRPRQAFPLLSGTRHAVLTDRSRSPAKIVTPTRVGNRFGPSRNSITTRPAIRCAACTTRLLAPSATLSRCSPTSARIAPTATPIFIAANSAQIANSVTPCPDGKFLFSRLRSTRTAFRYLELTRPSNVRRVTRAPPLASTRDCRPIAPRAT